MKILDSLGSRLDSLNLSTASSRIFADQPYFFKLEVLKAGDIISVDYLSSGTVFLVEGEIKINDILLNEPHQVIQSENTKLKIECIHKSLFFVAGVRENKISEKKLVKFQFGELKQVSKP